VLTPSNGPVAQRRATGSPQAPAASPAPGGGVARIGPNAVIQTLVALEELEGRGLAEAVVGAADVPPELGSMVNEAHFVRLVGVIRRTLTDDAASRVLDRSGRLTAAYVLRHRIPAPARGILPRLPNALALPLVLGAFQRHAWTFAGSGVYRWVGGHLPRITLDGCITCVGHRSLGPAGAFYRGAFEGLLTRLVDPGLRVLEEECVATGGRTCRFSLHLPGRPGREHSLHIPTPEGHPCASY
jgi:divinyl protochlorophyllide a 8-vinyl-reductase